MNQLTKERKQAATKKRTHKKEKNKQNKYIYK
jgi:hypothetical protein